MAGLVGQFAGLAEQLLPLLLGQAAGVPVGALVFAAVVEVADVVVRLLQRLDLGLDEGVELGQVVDEVLRQGEVHGSGPSVGARERALVGGVAGLVDGELFHRGGPQVVGQAGGFEGQVAGGDAFGEFGV